VITLETVLHTVPFQLESYRESFVPSVFDHDSHCPSDPFECSSSIRSPFSIHSLGRDFAVLLDMNVVIGLKDADFVIRELDRETLYQRELMLDLSAG